MKKKYENRKSAKALTKRQKKIQESKNEAPSVITNGRRAKRSFFLDELEN